MAGAWRSEFKYDAFGRRRVRQEYTWQSSSWVKTNEVRYVYDGLLTVQERDANNLAMVSYTRGNDLSGTRQGAGGIGGLLARTDHSALHTPQSALAHSHYHCDGNGNVTALVDTNGFIVARYQYDPYGNLLGMSGALAEANDYRFSSKEWHANTGLYYYGFRFYEPNLQRWLNRDPIEEEGGINLFEYSINSPVNFIDPQGLAPGDCYKSLGDAARAALQDVNTQSIKEQVEYGGFLYDKGNGKYTYGPANKGSQGSVSHGKPEKKYGQPIGFYHTHGGPAPGVKPFPGNDPYYPEMEEFSTSNGIGGGDKYAGYTLAKLFNNSDTWYQYLATPTGQFKMWNTKMSGKWGVDKSLGNLNASKPQKCK